MLDTPLRREEDGSLGVVRGDRSNYGSRGG